MPPRKSHRGPLSRTEIITAALDLAEEVGLESLSLHKLGSRLGVTAMSLYNHIDDKDDLLDAMGDHLLASVPLVDPGTDTWEAALRTMAHEFRAVVIAHPKAAPLLLTRRLNAPALLPVVEAALTTFETLGFDEREGVRVMRAFIAYLIGTLMREIGTAPSVAANTLAPVEGNEAILRDSGLPRVAASAPHLARCDHEAEMDYGLDLLITSVAHRAGTRTQPAERE